MADPTLSTTPDAATVTLGPPVTLKDTADLEGGLNPTGTITFTLIGPDGSTVDTEMVPVDGNGFYSTPTGFTPGVSLTGPVVAGAYQWNAAYTGDDNNTDASDIANPAEPSAEPVAVRYPMAGTSNADVGLWVVGLDGTRREVEWDRSAFPYLVRVVWRKGHPVFGPADVNGSRVRIL